MPIVNIFLNPQLPKSKNYMRISVFTQTKLKNKYLIPRVAKKIIKQECLKTQKLESKNKKWILHNFENIMIPMPIVIF